MKRKRSLGNNNKTLAESLPVVMWDCIGEFLSDKDCFNTGFALVRSYERIVRRLMLNFYKKEFNEYGIQINIDENYSTERFKIDKALIKINKDKYYTLVDRSYMPLFSLMESKDFELAKRVIEHKISNQVNGQKSITDMVFFQKNAHGKSIIMIARDLKQQDFLDFCFEQLLLNGPKLNQGKYSLVKTGDLKEILTQLDSSLDISVEALWMCACAFICNQKTILDRFERNWDKLLIGKIHEKTGLYISPSLAMIATLLGCLDLIQHIFNMDTSEHYSKQQLLPRFSLGRECVPVIYCDANVELAVNISDLAAMVKNIECLEALGSEGLDWGAGLEIAAFYLERRNVGRLEDRAGYWMSQTNDVNYPIILKDRYFNVKIPHNSACLSLLGIAVAQNCLAAVQLFVKNGAFLNGQFESSFVYSTEGPIVSSTHFPPLTVPVPLNIAINLGYYSMAVSLLKLGANPNSIDNYWYSNVPDAAIAEHKKHPSFFRPYITEPSALACAIYQGNLKFVQLLLQYGVSLLRETHDGKGKFIFPLIIAIHSNNWEIANAIIKIIGVGTALTQLSSEYQKIKISIPGSNSKTNYKMWRLKNVYDPLFQSLSQYRLE